MPRIHVEVGQRFGRLTVTEVDLRVTPVPSQLAKGQPGHRAALCRCDCGREALIRLFDLATGKTTSCGCSAPAPGVDEHLLGRLVTEFLDAAALDVNMLIQVMTAAALIVTRQNQHIAARVVRTARVRAVQECGAQDTPRPEAPPLCSLPDVCGTGRCPFASHPLLQAIDISRDLESRAAKPKGYDYARPSAHASAGETASIAPAVRDLNRLALDRLGHIRRFPLKGPSHRPEPDLDALWQTPVGAYRKPELFPDLRVFGRRYTEDMPSE